MADIVKLIKKQADIYVMQGASDEDIEQAEQYLNLRFAKDYREYIAEFGAASYENHELTGVCKSKRLSVVNVTIKERRVTAVPEDWYVLEQTNIDGIVIWQATNGAVYQTAPNAKAKRICGSLAAYIEM